MTPYERIRAAEKAEDRARIFDKELAKLVSLISTRDTSEAQDACARKLAELQQLTEEWRVDATRRRVDVEAEL